MNQEELLKKYFSGETELEEEKFLMESVTEEDGDSAEREMFSYFSAMAKVPENLENDLFEAVTLTPIKRKTRRMQIYQIASVAAVFAVVVSIFLGIRSAENKKTEREFAMMEKALFQVSESIQPQEQEEMIVLWVDDEVEIIIN
jgi:hypothetical protein